MQWKRLVQTTIGGGGSGNVGVKRQWYHGVGKAGNGGRRGATSSEAGQSDRYAIVNTQSHFVNTWAKHFDGKGQRINQEGAVIRAYRSINAFDTSRKIIILLTAWSASFRCGFGKKCAFTYDCHTTLSHTQKHTLSLFQNPDFGVSPQPPEMLGKVWTYNFNNCVRMSPWLLSACVRCRRSSLPVFRRTEDRLRLGRVFHLANDTSWYQGVCC